MRVAIAPAGKQFFQGRSRDVIQTHLIIRQPLQSREGIFMQRVRGAWGGRVVRGRRHERSRGAHEGNSRTRPRVAQQLADSQWLEELRRQGFDPRPHQGSGTKCRSHAGAVEAVVAFTSGARGCYTHPRPDAG